MSEARALTNLIGNGVATVVVGKWCGELDVERMKQHHEHETDIEADEPEKVLDEQQAHMGVPMPQHVVTEPARGTVAPARA